MSSEEKVIECKVSSSNDIVLKIPGRIVKDVFKNDWSNDFFIKKGKTKEFMNKFAEGLKETCKNDEFINDVLNSFVCDVDCVKERE